MFQKTKAFRTFFWISAIIIGFFVFFPLLWLINTALKPSSETFSTYFFVGPLTLDNIILTPHIGGASRDIIAQQTRIVMEDVTAYFETGKPIHVIQ